MFFIYPPLKLDALSTCIFVHCAWNYVSKFLFSLNLRRYANATFKPGNKERALASEKSVTHFRKSCFKTFEQTYLKVVSISSKMCSNRVPISNQRYFSLSFLFFCKGTNVVCSFLKWNHNIYVSSVFHCHGNLTITRAHDDEKSRKRRVKSIDAAEIRFLFNQNVTYDWLLSSSARLSRRSRLLSSETLVARFFASLLFMRADDRNRGSWEPLKRIQRTW